MTNKEKNSDDLASSFILFCRCGHSLNCHDPNRVPICDFDEPSLYPIPDKGRYECPCKEFVLKENEGKEDGNVT